MEVRRLQEMGGATLLVSIPKEWARSASLKKGSVVSIEESSDGGLLIYPVAKSGNERSDKEIELANPSKFGSEKISSEITAAYLLGYDLIRIKAEHRISPKDRERIITAIKRLIGLEIVEEDARSITSQFLVDNTAVEPSKIFKRISSIVRAMISDSLKYLTSGEATQFDSIAQRDDEVDRLHFLLVRLIRSSVRDRRAAGKFGLTAIDCLDYRVAASSLETAGDYAVELSDSISKLGSVSGELRDQIVRITDLLDAIQDNAVRSFLGKDFAIAQSVFQDYDRLEEELDKLRSSPDSHLNLLHFAETLEKIARCEHDVTDLVSPMGPA
jgi:phosphate uptake regulator